MQNNYIRFSKSQPPNDYAKFEGREQNTWICPHGNENILIITRKHFAASSPRVQKTAGGRPIYLLAAWLAENARDVSLALSFNFYLFIFPLHPSSVLPPSLSRWIDNLGHAPPAK
jgi:hypothetical protein